MSDDLQAIQRVLAGDVESFGDLVRRYQKPVFGLVRNLIPDAGDAEDIAQDVFLAAYTHLGAFDPRRAAFATWLFTIARNRCLAALKKRRPRPVRDVPEAVDRRTPDADAAAGELWRRLDAALAELPLEQKTAFVLAEIQGLSHEEVARIEGVRIGTVKSRLSRAREKLRSLLRRTVELP